MTEDSKLEWNDDRIVQYIKRLAIDYSNCGFNTAKANRIMDTELRPAYAILKSRGSAALRKLLPLIKDENSTVRWMAAGFAYEVEPAICRGVLEELMREPSVTGLMAWATLAEKNPASPPEPPRF